MKNRLVSTLPIRVFHLGIMAIALSLGVVIWQLSFHIAFAGERNSLSGHFIHAVGDTALLLPLALFVIVLGLIISVPLGLDHRKWHGIMGSASVVSILFFFGSIPGVSIHGFSHGNVGRTVEGFSDSRSIDLGDSAESGMLAMKSSISEASFHGFHDAAISQIIVLHMMILGVLPLSKSGNLANYGRRWERRE